MEKPNPYRDLENILNRMNPAAAQAQLGSLLKELIEKHNQLLAKLDEDEGVSGDDFAETLGIAELGDR